MPFEVHPALQPVTVSEAADFKHFPGADAIALTLEWGSFRWTAPIDVR
jgi:hypothetical protein